MDFANVDFSGNYYQIRTYLCLNKLDENKSLEDSCDNHIDGDKDKIIDFLLKHKTIKLSLGETSCPMKFLNLAKPRNPLPLGGG